MLSVEQVITERFPSFFENKPRLVTKSIVNFLRLLFHEKETNRFLEENQGLEGLDFIEKVLEYFDLDYTVSSNDLENIPPVGRVVIIANHPLGALDALALIQMVSRVRRDVKVVANDMLASLPPLKELILPVDNLGGGSRKSDIRRILDSLQSEEALVVFPAGEVSRLRPSGVRDGRWKQGFLQFARRTDSPILPVLVEARNSALFYSVSMLYKPLSALLLVGEMFRQRENVIGFRIGELIPARHFDQKGVRPKVQARLLRKHLYRLAGRKSGLFETEKSIAHPESRQELKRELREGELLGETSDGKQIILADWSPESSVMREIGRLRELSFRKVGEGTGSRRDLDSFDRYYRHLVLWDDEALEIAGAYRLGESGRIMEEQGRDAFYSGTLFSFNETFIPYLEKSLELGRSFVQPRYWGSRALDYLWQGLGAYLRHNSDIRYLFGPVSISANYPRSAQDMLIYFYRHYFSDAERCATARNPYRLSGQGQEECRNIFAGDDYKRDLQELKSRLSINNLAIPTLYKQYSEICEEGGVRFIDFGVDPDFAGCTDGFLLVDLEKVKPGKRKRYIGN
ncbi:MAG: lysophospholipid acyltransferase family protein [Candidatus Sedimenticola sp. PURPLELP]